jgi:hypothetical protein
LIDHPNPRNFFPVAAIVKKARCANWPQRRQQQKNGGGSSVRGMISSAAFQYGLDLVGLNSGCCGISSLRDLGFVHGSIANRWRASRNPSATLCGMPLRGVTIVKRISPLSGRASVTLHGRSSE